MAIDERGQGLLGAEDGAAEVGLLDDDVLDGDAEGRVGVWDAEEDDAAWVWCVEERGDGGERAVEGKGGGVSGRRYGMVREGLMLTLRQRERDLR